MRAAVYDSGKKAPGKWLSVEDVPRPVLRPGEVLLKVLACGVCRTDLHIVEGELPPVLPRLIPGHQIVGEVVESTAPELPVGMRAGVSWMGGVDGDCWFCRHERENLCNHPVFTGYTVNGGYAEFAAVRADFAIPLPADIDPATVAPLLCAGIIGFRSLRVAGVEHGERVGLYGFGSSASLAIQVLRAWNCEIYGS
jgi:propanol-preferring alcohol dehydrogenase